MSDRAQITPVTFGHGSNHDTSLLLGFGVPAEALAAKTRTSETD